MVAIPGIKERVVRANQHPRLRVYANQTPPFTHEAAFPLDLLFSGDNENRSFRIYFSRLWVENEGRGEARNVEVFVRRIFLELEENQLVEDKDFLAHNLRWANSWDCCDKPRRLNNTVALVKNRISVGIGRFCDLGFVVEPEYRHTYLERMAINANATPSPDVILELAFDPLTGEGTHCISQKSILEIEVDADNADAELHYLEVEICKWKATEPPLKVKAACKQTVKKIPRGNVGRPPVAPCRKASAGFSIACLRAMGARLGIRTRGSRTGVKEIRRGEVVNHP